MERGGLLGRVSGRMPYACHTGARRKPDGEIGAEVALADYDLVRAHIAQHIAGLLVQKVNIKKVI